MVNGPSCGTSKAPPGWWCSRDLGHDGPCAAHPTLGDVAAGELLIRLNTRRIQAGIGWNDLREQAGITRRLHITATSCEIFTANELLLLERWLRGHSG